MLSEQPIAPPRSGRNSPPLQIGTGPQECLPSSAALSLTTGEDKKHRNRVSSGRQKCAWHQYVSYFRNSLQFNTPPLLFLLCVVGPDHSSHSLQETGAAWHAFLMLFSVALSLAFARLQKMYFQAKLKNTSACSQLHMPIVVMVVSISSETDSEKQENSIFSCKFCAMCPLKFLEQTSPFCGRQIAVSVLPNLW